VAADLQRIGERGGEPAILRKGGQLERERKTSETKLVLPPPFFTKGKLLGGDQKKNRVRLTGQKRFSRVLNQEYWGRKGKETS